MLNPSPNDAMGPVLPGFGLAVSKPDPANYFASYLANGTFSTATTLPGTGAGLALMAALMDHSPGDVSRPAALPAWSEVDVSLGGTWLNGANPEQAFTDYEQILDLRRGRLRTNYRWTDEAGSVRIEVEILVAQDRTDLGVTRLRVTPAQCGPVSVAFPLEAGPGANPRLALGKLSWRELRDRLATSAACRPLKGGGTRPQPPREILTWFDLERSLAADNLELVRPSPTAPTRAAIWFPGEVRCEESAGDAEHRYLAFFGRAVAGKAVAIGAAIASPPALAGAPAMLERVEHGARLTLRFEAEAGQTYEFVKFAVVRAEGADLSPAAIRGAAEEARRSGFDSVRANHCAAWEKLWEGDIEIEGDADVQAAVRSDLFYLYQNSTEGTANAVPACAFSPHYFGHVFWDSDNWVFPALVLLHPERARSLVDFRSRTLGPAREIAARRGYRGAMYPWESDPERGTEQTPRFAGVNAEREIHLNGNIASAQWQYFLATGDLDWLRTNGFPVIEATAEFWLSRVTFNPQRSRYEILGVTSADEKYTDVDNDAFTNAVARHNLRIADQAARRLGRAPNPRWNEVAEAVVVPFAEAERRHLPFDPSTPHDRQTWMAGALTFLAYPSLDLAMPEDVRRNDYAYCLRKNAELSPEPNQMMLVMLGIHAASLGLPDEALHWLLHERGRFLKPPFQARSETPVNNATHILATGGGFLQNFLYGFTGLRLAPAGLEPLYPAVLPTGWSRLRLKGIWVRGERRTISVQRAPDGKVTLVQTGEPRA